MRTSACGSTGGPRSSSATPPAGDAAAGGERSRPWKGRETVSSADSGVASPCAAAIPPRPSPVEVVALGLGDDLEAVDLGFASCLRADRDGWNLETERRERPRCGRGSEHHEIAFGGIGGSQFPRAIQDDAVRVERFGEVRPSFLGAREQDAAGWVRQLGNEALLG